MPTPLPAASEWTGSTVTEGQFKTAQNQLRQFLADLLGTTGTQTAALAALGALAGAVNSLTVATTVVSAHRGRVLMVSGTWTLSLTAAATLGAGFSVGVVNIGGGTVTINPAGAETVDGATTLVLSSGNSCILVTDGTIWRTLGLRQNSGVAPASYGDATNVPQITVNAEGKVTAAGNVPISLGEVNTGANVGAGQGLVFRDKTGVTLNFRNLKVVVDSIVGPVFALQGVSLATVGNDVVLTFTQTDGSSGGGA